MRLKSPSVSRSRHSLERFCWGDRLVLFAVFGALSFGAAQQTAHRPAAGQQRQVAPDELEARVAATEQARRSGDASTVAATNRLVIASALRELAGLKLAESDYTASIGLYRNSMEFEDRPAVDEPLGYAELQTGHLDEAIELGEKAHADDPHNLGADRLLASALDQKGEYVKAVEPFTRIATAEPTVDNLYPLAECLLQTKRPEDKQRAIEVFAQMKRIAGDSGSLHVLMGRAFRDGGDMQAAIREFQRAIAIDPRTPHAHYFLGLAQLSLNDWKPTPTIEAELQKEAEFYPNDYLANYMLGLTTAGERKYEESDKYLSVAARIDPTSPDPALYLGMNAYAEGKTDRAEAMMRRAIKLTGSDEERTNYQIRRAYVDLTRIMAQSGRMEESNAFAAKARELQNKIMVQTQQEVSKTHAESGNGMGVAVVPLTRQQEDQSAPPVHDDASGGRSLTVAQLAAAKQRERALKSVLAFAYNDLATANAIQKDYPAALGFYQQAEHWDSGLPGLEKNLGLCAFRTKDYAEATRALSAAVREGDDSSAVRGMLGLSWFATDKYADAARTFEPLGSVGMTDSETGYAWAASLAHTGDMKKAMEVLAAYETQPRAPETLLLVGQLWTEIGDYARAVATLERALDSDANLPRAHFYEGLAYIRWEHWPEAAKEFQAELNTVPDEPDALYHLGFVDQQESKIDDALALYLKVIAANPDYANAQYEAGKILLDRGDFTSAAAHLQAAASLTPDKDYIHYQLQSAYRKLGRDADADRELEIYKGLKARARARVTDAIRQQSHQERIP
jgi:tetratricopeptide (TPR) repeat protein